MYTDPCDFLAGLVILQEHAAGPNKPICSSPRSLNDANCFKDTTRSEFLALVWTLLQLGAYLESAWLRVWRDLDAMCWIFTLTDASGELSCLHVRRSKFEFDFLYQAANKENAADALPRLLTEAHDTTYMSSCTTSTYSNTKWKGNDWKCGRK